MKTYEVIVRKIVTEAVMVNAESVPQANELGHCQASDENCEQILDSKAEEVQLV